jgi:hypothetical protein
MPKPRKQRLAVLAILTAAATGAVVIVRRVRKR